MSLQILGAGAVRPAHLAAMTVPPAWRKASRNMIMAIRSMEQALMQAPEWMERRRGELGLVVSTNSGELETSADFITTLARTGMARPVLFQNSLHNATAGFASIHFGLTGPVFTVSDGARAPGEAAELARQLVVGGFCSAVIVTLVEVHKVMADYIGETVGEGACTLLLGPDGAPAGDIGRPYEVVAAEQPLFDITRSQFFKTAERLSGAAR